MVDLLKFFKTRLDRNNPYGLTLTIGFVLFVNFLSGFISDLYQIFYGSRLVAAEPQIIALLQAFTPKIFQTPLFFITILANTKVVLAVVLLGAIFLFVNNKKQDLRYFVIIATSALIISPLFKILVERERPSFIHLIGLPSSFGFPSGHAFFSLCIYGFLFYLLYRETSHIIIKIILFVTASFLLLGIGLSRVYLGVHFPTDVFAGWNLGMTILIVFITVYEIRDRLGVFVPKVEITKSLFTRTAWILLGVFVVLSTISYEYRGAILQTKPVEEQQTTIEKFVASENLFSQNFYGQSMEPISFFVIGGEENITQVFRSAGWEQAQEPTLPNLLALSRAIVQNDEYPDAPVTPAFYSGRVNSLAFEKPTDLMSARQRHHTRYWRTSFTVFRRPLWVATASFDSGVALSSKIQLPTHKIDADIDKERELIITELQSTGLIKDLEKINLVGYTEGKNAAGDTFYTDGQAYIISL